MIAWAKRSQLTEWQLCRHGVVVRSRRHSVYGTSIMFSDSCKSNERWARSKQFPFVIT